MKQKIIFILPVLVLIICCGCYFYFGTGDKPSKAPSTENIPLEIPSDEPFSTISAIFKNSRTSEKKNRLENDYIRLWKRETWKVSDMWLQENLDGTAKTELRSLWGNENTLWNHSDILWLTNDWIYFYYMQYNNKRREDDYIVCRLPVENNDGVTTYQTEANEILFSAKYFSRRDFLVTDSYIFYGDFLSGALVDESICYYRYDFKTKKSEQLFRMDFVEDTSQRSGIYNETPTNLPVTLNNAFFIVATGGLYMVPFDTLEPVKIYSGKITNGKYLYIDDSSISHETDNLLVAYENDLYFTGTGTEIMKYDGDSGEVSCVLSKEQLWGALDEMKLWDEDTSSGIYSVIEGFRIQDGRLYINATGYGEKMSLDNRGVYSTDREVLLSANVSNLNAWKLEDALADYILDNATCSYIYYWSRDSRWEQQYLPETLLENETQNTLSRECYIFDMGDGKYLVSYFAFNHKKKLDGRDGIGREVLYDVGTGKILPLDLDWPAYYQKRWGNDEFSDYHAHWSVYDEYDD